MVGVQDVYFGDVQVYYVGGVDGGYVFFWGDFDQVGVVVLVQVGVEFVGCCLVFYRGDYFVVDYEVVDVGVVGFFYVFLDYDVVFEFYESFEY